MKRVVSIMVTINFNHLKLKLFADVNLTNINDSLIIIMFSLFRDLKLYFCDANNIRGVFSGCYCVLENVLYSFFNA